MPTAAELVWPLDRPLTIEDLTSLPDEGRKVELWDGVLLVTPGPTLWHQELAHRFCSQANAQLSDSWWARQEIMIEFNDPSRGLQPDATILRSEIVGPRATYPLPGDVAAVVEVESPSTKLFDRNTKPGLFAAGPVPVYVRIEVDKLGMPTVVVYAFDDGHYVESARSAAGHGTVSVPLPERVTIDVAALAAGSESPSSVDQ